jgi:hypothetical protein
MPPQENNIQQVPPVNNPVPANNPVPETPIKSKLNRNIKYAFLLVLTFLLIVAGLFAVWYFSNSTPDEETDMSISLTNNFSDWKTYRNEYYGIEFKYPSGWTSLDTYSGLFSIENKSDDGTTTFNVFLTSNSIVKPITGIMMESIKIDGKEAYRYFFQEGVGTSEVILIQKGNDVLNLNINLIANDGYNFEKKKDYLKGILDTKILSTFKFTK